MAAKYTVEQLNHGRKVYDFLRPGKVIFIVALLLVIASIVVMLTKGFNWGLDFTGGVVAEYQLSEVADTSKITEALRQEGFKDVVVQVADTPHDIMVRMAEVPSLTSDELTVKITAVIETSTQAKATLQKPIDFVGAAVGADLAESGAMAMIVSLLAILVYIALRFEWRLATGTVLALAHDVIITAGILSLFQRNIDLTIIAAMLSIIGYSLNDSIVVFDRMRENFRKIRVGTSYEIMNISLTQTLSRTLMTSGTTLMVVLCLYFFGGDMLKGFSETLAIGIVLGTVSSIWIAAYLALVIGVKRENLLQRHVEKEGQDQPSLLP